MNIKYRMKMQRKFKILNKDLEQNKDRILRDIPVIGRVSPR
jgi:hypothetical protein